MDKSHRRIFVLSGVWSVGVFGVESAKVGCTLKLSVKENEYNEYIHAVVH